MELNKSYSYCLDEVRRHDHDRYLTTLFLPPAARTHALALYAFNLEVARTREIVSEPLLGQIRLQWWRETIEGIFEGTPREHPVVAALSATIAACAIPRKALEALVDAREADMADSPLADLAALEHYAEETAGALSRTVMEAVTDADVGSIAARAAQAVGTAWALTGLARSVAFHARHHRLYIPDDLISEFEVERRRLFDLKPSTQLNGAVARIAERAQVHLDWARAECGGLSKVQRRVLLLATLADRHIARMRAAGFDPFAFEETPAPETLRLAWTAFRGGY
jgi:NADH dehydrogenase [ubiquinone] 1 alpha subcomplex assembly factor 6